MSDLFDQTVDPVVIDETKDYFTEFVGDDKKFKTPQELAKSKAYADAHIANLTRNLDDLRKELGTRKTAEDLINQIALRSGHDSVRANNPADRTIVQDQLEREPATGETVKSLTPADVERMFTEREQLSQRQQNLKLTTTKLTEVHGENAAKVISDKAKELGVDSQYLKKLAEDTPSIFLSLFPKPESKANEMFQAPPPNQFRTQVDQFIGAKWSDFNKVKATDPKKYHSAAFQRAIMEAAQKAADAGQYDKFMAS